MRDAIDQFREAIRAAGLTPPEAIEADGKLHRFSSNGKRRDDAGFYVLHVDGIPAGHFGDWRTGGQNWRADIGRTLSPAEERAHRERLAAMLKAREAEDAGRRADAASTAAMLWKAGAPAAADHPYLTRKQVSPVATLRELHVSELVGKLGYGPRANGEPLAGRVLLAPVKIRGKLSALEMIDESG